MKDCTYPSWLLRNLQKFAHWVFLASGSPPSNAVTLNAGARPSLSKVRPSRLSVLVTSTPWFAIALLTASRASRLSWATTSGDGGSSFEIMFGILFSWPLCPYWTLVVTQLTTLSCMAPPDFRAVMCLSESLTLFPVRI